MQDVELREKMESYKDLIAWQKTVLLIKQVYKAVQTFPKEEMFGLTSQIKRAAISVGSNIAEGSSKRSTREFIRFLNISYGSLMELEAQLIIAAELGFLSPEHLTNLTKDCNEVGKILNGLIRSLTQKLNLDD